METVREHEVQGKVYAFFVDDREFKVHEPEITGARIMEIAGIPVDVGLNLIEEDGTQRPVRPNEKVELRACEKFPCCCVHA